MSLSFGSSSTKRRSAWHNIVGQHSILGKSIQDAESALEFYKKNGLKVRVLEPGRQGRTLDHNLSRVNVAVDKAGKVVRRIAFTWVDLCCFVVTSCRKDLGIRLFVLIF